MNENLYYRIGFKAGSTEPVINTMSLIGTNTTSRVTQAFLAPVDEAGNLDMSAIHSIDCLDDGRPNGFWGSVEEAKSAVLDTLKAQVGQIQVAIDQVEAFQSNP